MLLWRTKQYLSGRPVVAYADMGKELWGEQAETGIMALMWLNWLLGLGDYMLVLQSTLQAVLYDFNLCQPMWGLVVVGMLLPLTQARSLHRIRSLGAIHIGCLSMVMLLVLARPPPAAPPAGSQPPPRSALSPKHPAALGPRAAAAHPGPPRRACAGVDASGAVPPGPQGARPRDQHPAHPDVAVPGLPGAQLAR